MLTESGNFLDFNELKQKETTLTMANYFCCRQKAEHYYFAAFFLLCHVT